MTTVSARVFVFAISCVLLACGLPVSDYASSEEGSVEIFNDTADNGTAKDLFVIKTIVYEVGILTDADNSTDDNSTETHEQVDLTFYDPVQKGNQIDLSNIPIPIQTNISGVTVTGIASANLGTIQLAGDGEPAIYSSTFPLNVPILPNALISVKQNISTTDDERSAQLLSGLPQLLHLTSPITGEPLRVEPISTEDKDDTIDGEKEKESTAQSTAAESTQ